jgi:hypothetical protein
MEFNKKEIAKLRKQYEELRKDYIETNNEDGEEGWEKKNLRPFEASFKRYVACVKDYIERRVLDYTEEFSNHYYKYYEEYVLLK